VIFDIVVRSGKKYTEVVRSIRTMLVMVGYGLFEPVVETLSCSGGYVVD